MAIRYSKSYALPEYNSTRAEYTIKYPTMSIVSDLYQKKSDVVVFSLYIWNINETIKVMLMLKKVIPDAKIITDGTKVMHYYDYWF